MKNYLKAIILIITGTIISACSSTQEATTTENRITSTQMAQWEDQQRINDNAERMGLDQEEVRRLNDYAKRKAGLECKMKGLEKEASEALSQVDAAEIKQKVIVADEELNTLTREIDQYCLNDPERSKFFYQIHKQYMQNCK